MKNKETKIQEISHNPENLADFVAEDLMELPFPDGQKEKSPPVKPLTDAQKEAYESSLDGVLAVSIPRPKTKEEEDKLKAAFAQE